jgi:hypothetical protein
VGGSPVEEAKQPSIWKPDRINAIPHIFKTLSKTTKPAMSKPTISSMRDNSKNILLTLKL